MTTRVGRTVAAFARVDLDITKRNVAVYNHGLDPDGNLVQRTSTRR
jgi:hypothetical protein